MTESAPEISGYIKKKPEVVEEPPYRVIIHNDNITPMNFVIFVLQNIFLLTGPRAAQAMFSAHFHGSAYVDSLPRGEAQLRIHRAHVSARMAGYPLLFTMERE
jgi:ATP-dependent Clp protease adaptor protein ClpS